MARSAAWSELLVTGALSRRRPLVVTGMRPTATSAMSAWCLAQAGMEAGWLLGSGSLGLPASSLEPVRVRPDRGRPPFVVDAEAAPHEELMARGAELLGLAPNAVGILTSASPGSLDGHRDATEHAMIFARAVPAAGLLVASADDPEVRRAASTARAPVAFAALEGDETGDVTPTWTAAPAAPGPQGGAAFDVYAGGSSCGRFTVRVSGLARIRSALACIAACAQGFGVDVGQLRRHLASFEGGVDG